MKPFAAACLLASVLALSANAAEIYRWVDENGKTQISDTVPARYKDSAVRVDSKQFELTPERQREAQARAARDKALLASPEDSRASAAAASGAVALTPGNASSTPAPAGTDCESLQRQYRESQECFAPFINANGSLKPQALSTCKAVENPTLKCGSPKAY